MLGIPLNYWAVAALAVFGLAYYAIHDNGWNPLSLWPRGSAEDRGFNSAFTALDAIAKVNADLKSDRIADLCAQLAEELTHAYYPRRQA